MADKGPRQEDLDNAKSYLNGSYPLRFDTDFKIATQLLGIKMDGFGPSCPIDELVADLLRDAVPDASAEACGLPGRRDHRLHSDQARRRTSSWECQFYRAYA